MKKHRMVSGGIGVVILFFASLVLGNEAEWENIGQENMQVNVVLVDSGNPRNLYFGSDKGVFKSADAGSSWRNVLSVRGGSRQVNFLLFDPQDKNSLYAATGNGLFFSANHGQNWKRVFQGKDALENECTGLLILPTTVYLGTRAGLFISTDRGRKWHKATGQLGSSRIFAVVARLKEPDCIYVACVDGVFKTQDAGKSWERVFLAQPTENGSDADEAAEDQDGE